MAPWRPLTEPPPPFPARVCGSERARGGSRIYQEQASAGTACRAAASKHGLSGLPVCRSHALHHAQALMQLCWPPCTHQRHTGVHPFLPPLGQAAHCPRCIHGNLHRRAAAQLLLGCQVHHAVRPDLQGETCERAEESGTRHTQAPVCSLLRSEGSNTGPHRSATGCRAPVCTPAAAPTWETVTQSGTRETSSRCACCGSSSTS